VKKADWALVILIVAIVGIAAYFIVNALMPSPTENLQKAETAPTITVYVEPPSEAIFHEGAINPTVKVTVGDQGGQQPFSLGRQ
jgi:hypothetical protein